MSSLPQLLFRRLQQAEKRGASVVIKIWPSSGWWHLSQFSRASPEKSTNPQNPSRSFCHIQPSRNHPPFWKSFHSETAFHHFCDFHLPEVFTIPSSSPFRRSQLRIWSSNNRSSMIFVDTYAMPLSPTFIMCNASINAGNYGQWQISRHAILPSSVSDHSRYNKFITCRSCSYNNPSISPPRQHPCQVYIWSFFS